MSLVIKKQFSWRQGVSQEKIFWKIGSTNKSRLRSSTIYDPRDRTECYDKGLRLHNPLQVKYADSLSDARKDIDNAARQKAEIDVKVARLRDDLAEYRARYV